MGFGRLFAIIGPPFPKHSVVDQLSGGGSPAEYGPHKALYSRWKRWSEKGIFARMLLELAEQVGGTDTLMIDATHLKTHRTASSLGLKKGGAAA